MAVDITKVQLLANRTSHHPIYYCHSNDDGHAPNLSVSSTDARVVIEAENTLYKIKRNPQTKNRFDIYMSIPSANQLGIELQQACLGQRAADWHVANVNPGAAAGGRMALPTIVWTRSGRVALATATTQSGTRMEKENGTLYVELETPHQSHIMMRSAEIHLGLAFDSPTGHYDERVAQRVNVPIGELQRYTNEQNPISKVTGTLRLEFEKTVGLGLGNFLQAIVLPAI